MAAITPSGPTPARWSNCAPLDVRAEGEFRREQLPAGEAHPDDVTDADRCRARGHESCHARRDSIAPASTVDSRRSSVRREVLKDSSMIVAPIPID